MKRLIVIALALISIQGIAQEERKERPNRGERTHRMSDLTPKEVANLKTKKMTLHFDLSEKQQKDIYAINLENATKRKAMMDTFKAKKESGNMEKPSKEQRLAMQNAKLDHQIATKAKMKIILNKEQFDKWEKSQGKMHKRNVGMKKYDGKKRGDVQKKQ
ncbi:hypothetical protein QLS71_010270 [Mariniflexile litorale]|uniref:LTXXQ motif family protein n=1 Tax=Mariniflexile litorale TaxID=3045158 RepID=A0AAU7EBJ0_9FLAO|nr:hypothetical protein [Mariniflexile sp. KMM 9835]MDQ8213387.1 hypothetical protein [Mariniflexile sp. KMM 9835]